MKRIMLLDSNAIVHRAFHALPALTSPDGKPINAVYGFASILLKIINELKPDYLLATFDLAAPTFRHIAYERYKATRVKAPDELYAQFPLIKEMLKILDIPIYEKEGYEADDIIGTAARFFEKKFPKDEIIIVTGDLDTLQLVSPRVKVFTMKKGITETILYDEKAVVGRFGFQPKFVIDYKGLRGDPSDNIPGVRGVGEKTACELIVAYGTIDDIYKNIKKIKKESLRKKLEEQKEEALFSRELATINTAVPIEFDPEGARWNGGSALKENKKLRDFFLSLGFQSLVRRLELGTGVISPLSEPLKKENATEGGIFELITTAEAGDAVAALFVAEKRCAIALFPVAGILTGTIERMAVFFSFPSGKSFCVEEIAFQSASLKAVIEDERIEKISFDGKVLARFFRQNNIFIRGIVFDVVLARYLLRAHEKNYDPKEIVRDELGSALDVSEGIVPLLFALKNKISEKLFSAGLFEILTTIEIPLISYLVEMEHRGILIDLEYVKIFSADIAKKLAVLEGEIYSIAGGEFNINSPSQVAGVLFEKLALYTKGLRKTKTGAQSTDASELAKLVDVHPIVAKILQHRELQKLKTTYIDVLPELADEHGAIHTTFRQTGTVTGRLSSADPNLQNIPIRSEIGKKIRNAFRARSGYAFCAFDYSQIELRIAAHMSGDPTMIKAFNDGIDIHRITAATVKNIPIDNVSSELRREAKALNFGILYGMGARAFAESAGVSLDEAKSFIERYFENFSRLKAFMDSLRVSAQKNGFVETLFHRRRYIPELQSPYIRVRMEGERMAINMPIQGTAADIMKLAMNKIYREILSGASAGDIYPVLQVHDELIFEVKSERVKKYREVIRHTMESVVVLNVPIVVDVSGGSTWGDL